jgi:hypothetical protein
MTRTDPAVLAFLNVTTIVMQEHYTERALSVWS